MPQSSRIEIRAGQQKQTPEFTTRDLKMKVKTTQEKQVSRPTTVIKIKKRKLFEEISTPVSKSKEALLPIRRTTRSMAKQVIVPNIPSLQREPMDILSSPEKGSGCGATVSEAEGLVTVSETEGLVTETLRGLRKEKEAREEVTKEAITSSPDKSLNKQKLIAKIERLKQEVEEYKVLDRHIKAENAQLKEQHAEVSAKLNKVLRLIQYTRVIKKELKSEVSGFNILQPEK
jgi:hypothetical protein